MKIALNIVGVLLILTGGVWFLQGMNVLLGSAMTGQTQWAWSGAAAFLIGVGFIIFANRSRVPLNGK